MVLACLRPCACALPSVQLGPFAVLLLLLLLLLLLACWLLVFPAVAVCCGMPRR